MGAAGRECRGSTRGGLRIREQCPSCYVWEKVGYALFFFLSGISIVDVRDGGIS